MSLEVKASLDRTTAVYLAGESITVTVVVHNVGRRRECIAWGSVQLCCERTSGAAVPSQDKAPTTSISKSNTNVYSSVPSIIFCDVELAPNEHRTFTAKIDLPAHGLPPSFRGHLLRYHNRITVGVQHLRAPIKMTHIPIRLIPSVGLETAPSVPQNPFLAESATQPSVAQIVTAVVDQITAPKKAYVFSMTNQYGKVATLTLFKKTFRLGEDVAGKLSFEGAEVACMQWSVNLETTEKLADDSKVEQPRHREWVVSHANENCVCTSHLSGAFRLPIPLSGPTTFHTDSVHVTWRLRFEFVTSTDESVVELGKEVSDGLWTAPEDVNIQTLSWQVDLYVLPCSPHNAALTDNSSQTQAIIRI